MHFHDSMRLLMVWILHTACLRTWYSTMTVSHAVSICTKKKSHCRVDYRILRTKPWCTLIPASKEDRALQLLAGTNVEHTAYPVTLNIQEHRRFHNAGIVSHAPLLCKYNPIKLKNLAQDQAGALETKGSLWQFYRVLQSRSLMIRASDTKLPLQSLRRPSHRTPLLASWCHLAEGKAYRFVAVVSQETTQAAKAIKWM